MLRKLPTGCKPLYFLPNRTKTQMIISRFDIRMLRAYTRDLADVDKLAKPLALLKTPIRNRYATPLRQHFL